MTKQQESLETMKRQFSEMNEKLDNQASQLHGLLSYLQERNQAEGLDQLSKRERAAEAQEPLDPDHERLTAETQEHAKPPRAMGKQGSKSSVASRRAAKRQAQAHADAAAQKRQRAEDGIPISPLFKQDG